MTPTGAPEMTSPDVLKVKTIKALLEALEEDDPKDAAEALRMIRALMGEARDGK
jgi:hypothetical protein